GRCASIPPAFSVRSRPLNTTGAGAVFSRSVRRAFFSIVAILLSVWAAACHSTAASPPPLMQPGAPGQASRVIAPAQAADQSHVQFTPADVKFMQGMIGHHAQVIEMTALVPSRTSREDLKKLAMRIDVSQADEIKMMQRWLQDRGQAVPGPHAMHMHGAML